MASEWLAPVSGAVLGIAGIVGGVWTARGGRKHDERLTRQRYEYERKHSHETWSRERRDKAYLDTLEMAEAVGQWLQQVDLYHPVFHPPDPLPSLETERRCWAQVGAHGSPEVKKALRRWRPISRVAVGTVKLALDHDDAPDDLFQRLRDEAKAREALTEAIAAGLGSVADGHPKKNTEETA